MQHAHQHVDVAQYAEMTWSIAESCQATIGDSFVASGSDETETVIGNEEPDWLAAMVNSAVGPVDQSSDFDYHEYLANSPL